MVDNGTILARFFVKVLPNHKTAIRARNLKFRTDLWSIYVVIHEHDRSTSIFLISFFLCIIYFHSNYVF